LLIIRKKQELLRLESERRLEEEKNKATLYKLPRFLKVPSRVNKENNNSSKDINDAKKTFSFLKKNSTTPLKGVVSSKRNNKVENNENNSPVSPSGQSPRIDNQQEEITTARRIKAAAKPKVPLRTEHGLIRPKSSKDFIVSNAIEAINLTPPKKEDDNYKAPHELGVVPTYLLERKAHMTLENERKRAMMPDPECPAGMKKLSQEEVDKTLKMLKESRDQAQDILSRMPLNIRTPSQRQKRSALDTKLQELDAAIKTFSRSKVFVPIEVKSE
jgi:hypothetical protein